MKRINHILSQIILMACLLTGMATNAAPLSASRCSTTDTLPTVTTMPVYNISETSARTGGTVNKSGGSPVTARGVCWGTTENPTLADNFIVNGDGTGSFNSNLMGLAPGVTYYVRAYATNSVGTGYGEALPFATLRRVINKWDTTWCDFPPVNPPIDSTSIHIKDSIEIIIEDIDTVLTIDTILDPGTPDSANLTFFFPIGGYDIVLHLTFVYTFKTVTACFQYLWPATGEVYTNSGTYYYSHTNSRGQLVTNTLNLTIISPTVSLGSIAPVTVCENQSVNLSANATGSGNVSLNWTGPSNFSGSGSEVSFNNATTAMAGTYMVTAVTTQDGCIATASTSVAVTVHELPNVYIIGNTNICKNESVTLYATGAQTYSWSTGSTNNSITETPTASTTYSVVGTDENQCQNSASVLVTVHELPEVTVSGDAHICAGETAHLMASGAKTYTWSNGATNSSIDVEPTVTTNYTVVGTDENDCSNNAGFTVTVGQSDADDHVYADACESFYWPLTGMTYTTSGTYLYQNDNAEGCMNTHYLHLTITHNRTEETTLTKCESYTWPANGQEYTQSGTYSHSYTTPVGCEVTQILHLNINHGTVGEETDTGCEHYAWPANGQLYTESGDYVFEYTNLFGCPSTQTLHLTIKHGRDEVIQKTVRGDTYTWPINGTTYAESGTYVYHYQNEEGCPSTITLQLTLVPGGTSNGKCAEVHTEDETCEGQDGSAYIVVPGLDQSDYEVTWNVPGGNTHGTSVNGLTKGTYSVRVMSSQCPNVKFFEDRFTIDRDDECKLKVNVSGPNNLSFSCNSDAIQVTFTATVTGGTPPYYWSDDGEIETVSSGGNTARQTRLVGSGGAYVTFSVRDGFGNTGVGHLSCHAQTMECSEDPNEIVGPAGYDDSLRYVNATDKMSYAINFENDPDFATAPASRVKITYDVPASQNIASFRLADFGFGSHIFTVPSNVSSYSQRLDVSDSLGVWVDVTAGIDILNHQIFWIFQSIDPATGFEPSSSQMGFLPINDSLGHGEGYVNFYIQPDGGVQTGDTVAAEALIVFDDNEPIGTNVWRNTFDAVAPTSTLHAELDTQDSLYCTFSFTAQDDQGGSGVRSIETFVSVNNGAYTSIGICHPDSTLAYALESGLYYQFMSLATDNVGNTEPSKARPDTAVNYNVAPFDLLLDGTDFYEYVPLSTYIGTFTTLDDDINQPFVYELVGGDGSADNNLFTIVNNNLRTNSLFECSHQTEYSIRVRSTDIGGLSIEKTFTLTEYILHETPVTYLNEFICQGESFNFHGRSLNASGSYTDTLSKSNGCDSIVTLFLTVNPTAQTPITQSICQGESFDFFGQTLTEAGTYTQTLQTVKGCDSVITMTLIVNPVYNTPQTQEICQGESYDFFGQTLTEEGTYTHTLQTVKGCDSVITLTLTVNPTYNMPLTQEICQGESIDFFGETLTTAGTYTHTLQSIKGCDSVVILTLTVNPTYNMPLTQEICQGESFDFFGEILTTAGTFTHTLQSIKGCDSVITLTLTVNPTYNMPLSQEICQGDSFDFFGETLTTAGTYTHTLQTSKGCDSVITMTLTVNPVYNTPQTQEICQGDSYDFFGQTLTEEGTYTHTLQTVKGCDSTITLTLTVNPTYNTPMTQEICQGESFDFFGETLTTAGTYFHTLQTSKGCDSVITLSLTVNPTYTIPMTQVICQGESFDFFGETLTEAGTYTHMLQTVKGCDSVIALTLTVNPLYNTPISQAICQGESYNFFGQMLDTEGTYTHTLQSVNGCDSTITLTLTVVTFYSTSISQAICQGESLDFYGQTLTTAGSYTHTLQSISGCDSIITLTLTVNPSSVTELSATICDGESYPFFDNWLTTSGDYSQTLANTFGCDSLVNLHLTVNPTVDIIVYDTAIREHEYTYNDFTITPPDSGTFTYDFTFSTVEGCDSIVHLILYVQYNDGIDPHTLSNVEVYPNPAQSLLYIKGEGMNQIMIYNADGQLVYVSNELYSDLHSVDVSRYAAGQYFVKIMFGNKQIVTKKVIVNGK